MTISQLVPWNQRKIVALPALESLSALSLTGISTATHINDKLPPIRALFNRRVLIAAGSDAGIALIDIAFRTVQPVFYATPVSMGGLGLDTPTIGTILAVQGMINGLVQPLIFAKLHNIMGTKNLWLFAIASGLPMVALFPVLNTLARSSGIVQSIWSLVGLQAILLSCTSFAYGLLSSFPH